MTLFSPLSVKRRLQAQLTKILGAYKTPKAAPDELMGELFHDVQLRRIYPDSITFVDLVPGNKLRKILKLYEKQRQEHGFDLHEFVKRNFRDYLTSPDNYHTNPQHTIEQHIDELWSVLTRENYTTSGSLIALPYPYTVPGGRYQNYFYWDSYFAMLGLAASGRYDLVEGMVKNYAYMIRKYGYIPNGNRTYYIGRSQPPFFCQAVRLLARQQGDATLVRYLPYLLAEYRFWMKGEKQLHRLSPAYRHVVLLPDDTVLNRYYDAKRAPRPEGYREDVETAHQAISRTPSQVYLDIRSATESGWDFSSRWMADGKNLHTIHTTDLIPVDLNSLLVLLEMTIADAYKVLKQRTFAQAYKRKADQRAAAIRRYCWSAPEGFFMDYDFVAGKHTPALSLAGVFPLYAGVATQEQAAAVAEVLEKKFLQEGGLPATLVETGQQWDAPNGWPPLQWVAIQGLREYGFDALASEIKRRWIETARVVYDKQGKLVEKYNVYDIHSPGGGGEYGLQDGFSWTNGVLRALLAEDQ